MKYTENDIKAVYVLNNFGSLVVLDVLYGINDYLITAYSFGDGLKQVGKNRIRYDEKSGNDYILKSGQKFFINDFLRI